MMRIKLIRRRAFAALLLLSALALTINFVWSPTAFAQKQRRKQTAQNDVASGQQATAARGFDQSLFKALQWREIGPFRGGRVTAVAGVPSQPFVYYFGATGGGVWKTTDGGGNWQPVSDTFFKTGSVGSYRHLRK